MTFNCVVTRETRAAAAGTYTVTTLYFTKFVSTLFINIILIFLDFLIVFRVYNWFYCPRTKKYITYDYFKSCGVLAKFIFLYIKVKILKMSQVTGSLEWDLGNMLIKVLNVFLTLRTNILGSK